MPGLVEIDHERDVVVRPGRAVAAPEQAPIDVGQRVDVHRHLRAAGRDADGDGVAGPVEAVQRAAEHGRVADAVEGPGDPAEREERPGGRLAVGRHELAHGRRRVAGAGVDEVGGAELPPQRLLGRHGVDRHDPRGARDAQALNHVQAHAADAEDRRRVARLHLGPVQDGADAGQHAAADEAGRRERDVLGDADRLHLADDRDLREDRSCGEVRRRLALEGEGRRDVAERALAPRRVPRPAGAAGAAAGQGGDHHVIARLHGPHGIADGFHDAGAFVAEHGGSREGDRAVDHRQVGVAHPRRLHADLHFVRPGTPHLELVGDLDSLSGVDDASHCVLLSFPTTRW